MAPKSKRHKKSLMFGDLKRREGNQSIHAADELGNGHLFLVKTGVHSSAILDLSDSCECCW